jgi:hypothetical protein
MLVKCREHLHYLMMSVKHYANQDIFIRIAVWTFLSKLQVQELVKKKFTNF